jgi:AraC-like DNA-binding protein
MLARTLPRPLSRLRDDALTPELALLRAVLEPFAPAEGGASCPYTRLKVYRFDQVTRFDKAPAFGVTLGLVLRGEKQLRLADHTLTVRPGELVLVTRETLYLNAITEAPYLGVSLSFTPEAVARSLVALAEAGEPKQCIETVPAFVDRAEPRIVDTLRRLVGAVADPVERQMLVPLAQEELLFHLLRSPAAAAIRGAVGTSIDRARILEAMRFIRANATRALSVDEIARGVAMSPSHFAHRFRDVARISPMRYLREVRLENARLMLLDGRRAGEVATEVGFESPSHFTREFKRRFGQPPSLYRAPA